MKQIIKDVLSDIGRQQVNLESESAQETLAVLISSALESKGTYTIDYEKADYLENDNRTENDDEENRLAWTCVHCGKSTYDVEWDYIGSGTNHLSCDLDISDNFFGKNDKNLMSEQTDGWPGLDKIISREELVQQAYREITADGLPSGGDLEAMKLAESIVDGLKEGDYIYESPDGGGTVFRRKFKDYDPKNKEEIDWKTKEPTGRKFKDYNNGNWNEDTNKK